MGTTPSCGCEPGEAHPPVAVLLPPVWTPQRWRCQLNRQSEATPPRLAGSPALHAGGHPATLRTPSPAACPFVRCRLRAAWLGRPPTVGAPRRRGRCLTRGGRRWGSRRHRRRMPCPSGSCPPRVGGCGPRRRTTWAAVVVVVVVRMTCLSTALTLQVTCLCRTSLVPSPALAPAPPPPSCRCHMMPGLAPVVVVVVNPGRRVPPQRRGGGSGGGARMSARTGIACSRCWYVARGAARVRGQQQHATHVLTQPCIHPRTHNTHTRTHTHTHTHT